jgi:hypothetical protein
MAAWSGSALGNIRASSGSTAASIAKEVTVSTTMPAKTESTLRIMVRESTGRGGLCLEKVGR